METLKATLLFEVSILIFTTEDVESLKRIYISHNFNLSEKVSVSGNLRKISYVLKMRWL